MELGNLLFGNSRGEFPVERGEFENIFQVLIDELGDKIYPLFKNDVFQFSPYSWDSDCECVGDEHDPDCLLIRPNFIYYPAKLEISWYKYPFRDSYSNKKFTQKEFFYAILDCINSLKGDK